MDMQLTIREGKSKGLFRTFEICNAETQETLKGFESIVGNYAQARELAMRLSVLDDPEKIEALCLETVRRSDSIAYDIYASL